ncbi:hypothetical protein AB0K00_51280 [Dactylosporangium sp. NPDC049525]|uniref:hypothetical protein n=1 Tax=Dactylosporangium sp. NPDC049525 TaxID=3154730 RepID=UPI003429CF0A
MFVFDDSALVALFAAYMPVYRLWERADRGQAVVGFPAAAMAAAGHQADVSPTAWDPLLWSVTVSVLPFGEEAAKQVGSWTGSLAAKHVIWESRATGWPVLTCAPEQYGPGVRLLSV